jgi:hypothetical protein
MVFYFVNVLTFFFCCARVFQCFFYEFSGVNQS